MAAVSAPDTTVDVSAGPVAATVPVVPAPVAAPVAASLYVGDLAPDVTEGMLYEKFHTCGPITSIRVCRDTATRRSLGYAYVNFQNHADADLALDTLNYSTISGRQIRIMWSHRDPSVRRSNRGNVFIKNLDKAITHQALYDTLSEYGNILSCKVAMTETGESKGFGFVHFETQEGADGAIQRLNGMLVNGKKVYLAHFVPRSERGTPQSVLRYTNVYVKNIPAEWTLADLQSEFSKHGAIKSAVVMTDDAGKSRRFGFVCFNEPEAASAAVAALHDKEFPNNNGDKLFVGRHQKKAERQAELRRRYEQNKAERASRYQGVNLYIKNLDESINDEVLRNHFAPHGTITSAKVMMDGNISKGFGFVCFTTPEEAQRALMEMHGRLLGNKPIYVALHQRREVRRQILESRNMARGNMQMAGMFPYAPQGAYYGVAPQPQRYPYAPHPRGGRYQQAAPYMQGAPRGAIQYPQQMATYGVYPQQQQQQQQYRMAPQGQPMQQGQIAGVIPGQAVASVPIVPGASFNAAPHRGGGGRGNPQGGRGFGGGGRGGRGGRGGQGNAGGAPIMQGGIDQGQGQAPQTLTLNALVDLSLQQQKQLIGERIYPHVMARQPQLASKITGMLLEMDNAELLHLLEAPQELVAKVDEAVAVLDDHNRQQAAAAAATGNAGPAAST